jgi:hypothetical protein
VGLIPDVVTPPSRSRHTSGTTRVEHQDAARDHDRGSGEQHHNTLRSFIRDQQRKDDGEEGPLGSTHEEMDAG